MRVKLKVIEDERRRFRALFERFGKKINYKGYTEETILFKNVTDVETNEVITEHIWFTMSKTFEKVNLIPGVIIEFDARVKEYKKGYVNKALGVKRKKLDYKLSHPSKVTIVKK